MRIFGTKGEPPPPTLKVAMNEIGGHRHDVTLALTGLDIDAKAALLSEAFWTACPTPRDEFASVSERVVRTDHVDPSSNEAATGQWRLTLKDPDERKLGRPIFDAITSLALANIPGFYGLSMGHAQPYGVYTPAVIDPALVPMHVVVVDGPRAVVESTSPTTDVSVTATPGPVGAVPTGPTTHRPLGDVFGARSGDKGGNANLGIFARSDAAYLWLEDYLTADRVRELLPEAASLDIDVYPLPSILSVNVVIHGLLQEGVAASTRQDGQAKSLGEWWRSRCADLPDAIVVAP